MSWLTSIFSGGVDKVVDSVSKGLDNLFTSDEERMQLKNKLQEAMNEYNLEVEKVVIAKEAEITKRWQSDNEHALTRLVRPAIVIWSCSLLTLVMVADGNFGGFTVKEAYIPLLNTIVATSLGGYFMLRSFDKYSRNKNKVN